MANTKIPVELSSTPGIVDNSNATAITIDSSENVGIGTDSISGRLEIKKATTSNETIFAIEAEGATTTTLGSITYDQTDDSMRLLNNSTFSGSTLRLGTVGSDDVIIDNNGNVGIGTSSPDAPLHTLVSSGAAFNLFEGSSGKWVFGQTSGGSCQVGGLFGSHSGLVVDTSGNVGIGTTSPDFKLDVVQATGSQIHFGAAASEGGWLISTDNNQAILSGGSYWSGSAWIAEDTLSSQVKLDNGTVIFSTNSGLTDDASFTPTERMRIDSSGNLLVGTTSQGYGTFTSSRVTLGDGDAGDGFCVGGLNQNLSAYTVQANNNTGTRYFAFITNGSGSQVGSISFTSSGTSYNTSSDARLKDVTGEARGLEVINELNPVAYNWKESGQADEGLIAQEVLDIVPNAVTGSEEEMYQMDYSKLVVHLVAGMKEQQAQIDALQSEINLLKGE